MGQERSELHHYDVFDYLYDFNNAAKNDDCARGDNSAGNKCSTKDDCPKNYCRSGGYLGDVNYSVLIRNCNGDVALEDVSKKSYALLSGV